MSKVVELVPAGTFRLNKKIRNPPKVNLGELTPNNIGTLKKLNQVLFPVAYSDKFYKDVLNTEISPEDYSKLVFYQDLAVGNIVCRLEPVDTPPALTLASAVTGPVEAPQPSTSTPKSTQSSSTNSSKKDGKTAPVVNGKEETPGPQKLYIMTLGVLTRYRRQGLATKLVQHVLSQAAASHLPPPPPPPAPEQPPAAKKAKTENKEKDDGKEGGAKKKEKKVEKPKPVIESVYLHVQVSNDEAKKFWERNGFTVAATVPNYYRKIEPRDAWLLEKKITKPEEAEAK
ncbi:acyl-CoA N-acyltransferase [Meredithblackwellia eburnea MCA 4105]